MGKRARRGRESRGLSMNAKVIIIAALFFILIIELYAPVFKPKHAGAVILSSSPSLWERRHGPDRDDNTYWYAKCQLPGEEFVVQTCSENDHLYCKDPLTGNLNGYRC